MVKPARPCPGGAGKSANSEGYSQALREWRQDRGVEGPRKAVAFAIHTYPGSAHLVARAEDGSLWLMDWQEKAWRRVPDLPADEGKPL